MKIIRIETIPYKIPYLTPLEFATGSIIEVENVLVRIHTDEGIIGCAEAPSRPYIYGESQASIIYAIQSWFGPSLANIDLRNIERVYHAMRWVTGNQTARAAIDMAIWDALGQLYQRPCYQLLGGWDNKIAVSHMIGYDQPQKMVEHALMMKDKYGVTTFKVKTGRNVHADITACKALRKAMPEACLYLDSNHGWPAHDAIYAAQSLRDENFLFFEEPSPASDRIGRKKLANVLAQPICGDESCTSLNDVAQEINDGMVSFICIKTARTGFTESAKIAALCEGLQVPVYVGNQGDTQLGTLANIQFACARKNTCQHAAELTNFLEIADDLSAVPLVIKEGFAEASTAPGTGIMVDEDKLTYYRCDK
ncbi:mandelate racemase/muconate lactonizing enzyme family protein [Providencia huaxiensis]|uniref:mandelate racemase/muconate lactonizing enzyme family protein n=1 Tax=Providencia huaxiensis TaxID=2027290 RepID=UPI0034E5D732